MVFAGPVFPEWYWGPIFFLIFFSPVILAVAVVVNWRVRRLPAVRAWATIAVRRYAIVLASLVVSALLVAAALTGLRAMAAATTPRVAMTEHSRTSTAGLGYAYAYSAWRFS
jgi:hypothetical protein